MRLVLSSLGIGAALVVMVASGYMNFRYGVIKYSGDVELDGLLFGAVTAAFDLSKALVPLFVAWAFAGGRYLYSVLGAIYITGCIGFSLTASTGFLAEKRDSYVATRTATSDSYDALSLQLREARQQVASLGLARPVATITAELAAKRQHRRWDSTKGCSDATYPKSRSFCASYEQLQGERGTAQARERAQAQVRTLAAKVAAIRQAGGTRQADPQMHFLNALTGIKGSQLEVFLILVMVLLLEFGSAFGLYFALQHGAFTGRVERRHTVSPPVAARRSRRRQTRPAALNVVSEPPVALLSADPERVALEVVGAYSIARLVPAPGCNLKLATVYTNYRGWAEAADQEAITRSAFDGAWQTIAREVPAIEVGTAGRAKVLHHVAFKAEGQAA